MVPFSIFMRLTAFQHSDKNYHMHTFPTNKYYLIVSRSNNNSIWMNQTHCSSHIVTDICRQAKFTCSYIRIYLCSASNPTSVARCDNITAWGNSFHIIRVWFSNKSDAALCKAKKHVQFCIYNSAGAATAGADYKQLFKLNAQTSTAVLTTFQG